MIETISATYLGEHGRQARSMPIYPRCLHCILKTGGDETFDDSRRIVDSDTPPGSIFLAGPHPREMRREPRPV